MSKADFEQQKNFVKALAGHFQFGPSASQFGVITFSTNAKLDITLNRYGDAASFQKGVNAISHEGISVISNYLYILPLLIHFKFSSVSSVKIYKVEPKSTAIKFKKKANETR